MSVRVRYSDELYHYGVPGQKHGVRKYQNSDGSLTPLGRIHYGVGQARSAAAAGVTKVKRAASAGAEKVGTGVRNAANATGNFVKTNAPIAAKATGRAVSTAAKATGNVALKGAKATGNAALKGAKYVASGQMRRDRTRRLNERAQYRTAKAADIKSKYAKKYAKKQAKEDRYMAKMRYKEERKRHTIIGKAKGVLQDVADISGKVAPIGMAALTIWLGGGFGNIASNVKSLGTATAPFKTVNAKGVASVNPVLGGTREAQYVANKIIKSASKSGALNPEYVRQFRSEYGSINPTFIADAVMRHAGRHSGMYNTGKNGFVIMG